MARIKQEVLAMIERLPDEASLDEIMAELYFRLQVDAGLAELDAGQGIPHEEVERKASEYRPSPWPV
jgi:predicted transcriptional regulator